MRPTSARIWMTGVASTHFGPRTTSHEVRRNDREADERRDRDQRRRGAWRGSTCPPSAAGRRPCARTPGRRPAGAALRCGRTGRGRCSSRARTSRAPTHRGSDRSSRLPDVAAGLVEQVLAEDVAGEARRAAGGSRTSRSPTATTPRGTRGAPSTRPPRRGAARRSPTPRSPRARRRCRRRPRRRSQRSVGARAVESACRGRAAPAASSRARSRGSSPTAPRRAGRPPASP